MDNATFLKSVNTLVDMHENGLLGGEIIPEDVLIDVVTEGEMMNVLTLAMALNYQINSYTLLKSVINSISRFKYQMDF